MRQALRQSAPRTCNRTDRGFAFSQRRLEVTTRLPIGCPIQRLLPTKLRQFGAVPGIPTNRASSFATSAIHKRCTQTILIFFGQKLHQHADLRVRDEQKSLARQIRDDHAKLQAIVANPNIPSNLSGLSEIQSRLETADLRSQQVTSELAVLEAQRIDDQQITNVLAGFDDLWQSLPTKEQVHLVRLLIQSVSFDGPGGNVAITFHSTSLQSLTINQLEYAQ